MEEKTNCVPVAPQPDAQKEKRRRKIRRIAGKSALYVIMCAIAVVMVIPFYWSIITSIRPKEEILRLPVTWFPGSFTAEHYKYVFDTIPFWEMLFNSILVTCIGLFTNLFFGSLAAYAFSKIRFSGHKVIFNILLTSMMIPGVITLIPTFFVLLRFPLAGGNNLFGQGGIGFYDNLAAVFLPGAIGVYGIFFMRQFFASLPDDMAESARMDGANDLTILFKILLPLSVPILVTFALYYGVERWNEWYNGMLFIRSFEKRPLQLVLRGIIQTTGQAMMTSDLQQYNITPSSEGIKMACIVVTATPIIAVYPFIQKYFVSGLTVGAVKG